MKSGVDVVIIGGGVTGSSIACNLRADGFKGSVVVVERDPTYQYASSSLATGGVRQQFGTVVNIQLTQYSVRFYEAFDETMAVNGEKPRAEFKQVGYLFLGNQKNWPVLQRGVSLQKNHHVPVRLLAPEDIKTIVPHLNTDDLMGATFGPKDGVLDPNGVLQGFVKRAKSLSVHFLDDEAVQITKDKSGVSGVVTKGGARLSTRSVVNAAGPWAQEVANMVGVDIPVVPVRRQIFVCRPSSDVQDQFPMVVDPTGTHWRSETGRRVLVAKARKDEPPGFNFKWERGYFMDDMWPDLVHRYPPFDRLRIERGWAGLYAVSPDENAIYGEHPEIKGLYLANGFSGHGLMMAPATGKVMSEIVRLGRSETIDVTCLGLDRYEAGMPVIEEAVL
jgi:glycine/D-amino acid oxidase-like deaminating enzyme